MKENSDRYEIVGAVTGTVGGRRIAAIRCRACGHAFNADAYLAFYNQHRIRCFTCSNAARDAARLGEMTRHEKINR